MRLTQIERATIVTEAKRCFGPTTSVMLFGSRTDDSRRGGDIDLLVEGPWEGQEALQRKIRFLAEVKARLGDQRIDVVIAAPGDRPPIAEEATRAGVVL